MSYASRTQVTEQRSRDEIEKILLRFGADGFGYFTANGQAMIGFTHQGLSFKLTVPLPDRADPIFTETPTGKARSNDVANNEWQAEVKRRWRSLCLVAKRSGGAHRSCTERARRGASQSERRAPHQLGFNCPSVLTRGGAAIDPPGGSIPAPRGGSISDPGGWVHF